MNLPLTSKIVNLIITGVMSVGVVGATAIAIIEDKQENLNVAENAQEMLEAEDNSASAEQTPEEPSVDAERSEITLEENKSAEDNRPENIQPTNPQPSVNPTPSSKPKEYGQQELIDMYTGTCPKDIPADIYSQQQKVFWVELAVSINPFANYNMFSNDDTILNIIQHLFYSSVLDDFNYTIMYTAWQLKVPFESYATNYTMTYNAEHGYPYTSPMYDFGAYPTIYPDAGIKLRENKATRTISWYYADYRDGSKYPLNSAEVARVEALADRISTGWQNLYNQYVSKCGTSLR